MKLLSLLFLMLIHLQMTGQQASGNKANSGKDNLVNFGAEIPVGNFASTHAPGIGIEYSRTKNRFGIVAARSKERIDFVYGGGAAIYFGKKETVSLYAYEYPAYLLIKASAGVLYKPGTKLVFTIAAGPAIGIYNGNTQFNLNSKLEGNYFFSGKLAITPGIVLMKEMTVADPLIAFSLKASLAL